MSNELFAILSEAMAKRGHDTKYPGAATTMKRAVDIHTHLHQARATTLGKVELSQTGQQREIKNHVAAAAPAYMKQRRMVDAARAAIDAKRAAMKPTFPKADPVILCAVAARVAALKHGEQEQLLAERNVDPLVAQAVLTLPGILHGVREDTRSRFESTLTERMHGPAVAMIEDEREAWATADAALKVVESALYKVGEFSSNHQYREWLKTIAPPSPKELALETREMEKFAAASVSAAATALSFEAKSKLRDDLLTQMTEEVTGKPATAVA